MQSCLLLEEKVALVREEENERTKISAANAFAASVSTWVASFPFPPPSLSLSLSFPPPFIGSRISKSLVVKSAAALLCFACHARFWSTDGRRRNCVRWPQCRGMNIRPDISPPFLKVADLAPPHLPSYSCLPVEGGEDSKCGISSSALQPGHCCD